MPHKHRLVLTCRRDPNEHVSRRKANTLFSQAITHTVDPFEDARQTFRNQVRIIHPATLN